MSTVFTGATIYNGETVIENGYIRFDETIQEVGPMTEYEEHDNDKTIDVTNKKIIPGFIDIHSHGGYGIDNMDADPEKINQMVDEFLNEGITSYFATTMTQTPENIEASLVAIKEAMKLNDRILGIHVEGPFINVEYKGAQSPDHIMPADVELMKKWQELSGSAIRLVTYAPEQENVNPFEKYCLDEGIVLSAGHSAAVYSELKESSATHITHLFNGQRGLHHREPGVAGYGLLEDNVMVEMIVDGHHIDHKMVDFAYRIKGAEGIVLITDSMRAKGLPDGVSELGGQKVIVKDATARLENGSLAGSALTFIDAFRNMIDFTNCSIEEAVLMSSTNQAKEFNLSTKGLLKPNYDADLLVLDHKLNLEKTIYGGQVHQCQ